MAVGRARGTLGSVAVPPELSATTPGSVLSIGDGAGAIDDICKSAFRAAATVQGRARGRRAGRRNHPERVVEPCALRSRRVVMRG